MRITDWKWLTLLSFGLALPQFAKADNGEKSIADSRIESEYTSDKFERTSVKANYRNHRRDLLWSYEGEAEKSQDWGINLDSHKVQTETLKGSGLSVQFVVAKKWSPRLLTQFSGGVHDLKIENKSGKTFGVFANTLQWYPKESFYAVLNWNRDLVYSDLALPKGLSDYLLAQTVNPILGYKPNPRLSMKAKSKLRWYSDGNAMTELDIEIKYGILPGTPWLWMGLGGSQLRNRERRAGYWSPEIFRSYGPRVEGAFDLYKKLSWNFEYSPTKLKEEDGPWGNGFAIFSGLQLGQRNTMNCRLSYGEIESAQSGRKWRTQIWQLAFQGSF